MYPGMNAFPVMWLFTSVGSPIKSVTSFLCIPTWILARGQFGGIGTAAAGAAGEGAASLTWLCPPAQEASMRRAQTLTTSRFAICPITTSPFSFHEG
jgi:hypothetical protein